MEILKAITYMAEREGFEITQSAQAFNDGVTKFSQIMTFEPQMPKDKLYWRGELWDKIIVEDIVFQSKNGFHISITEGEEMKTFTSHAEEDEWYQPDPDGEGEPLDPSDDWAFLNEEDEEIAIVSPQNPSVKKKLFKVLEGGKIES